MEITKTATESLSLENSFTTIREQDNVELHITVGIKGKDYGWFEFYDKKTGGADWYAEGGLWFEGKELVDYDGVFALPDAVLDILESKGFDVTDMRG
jgi:hypothetical protein